MKSKDLQNIVRSKYQKGDTVTEIHRHLNGGISLATIKTWCRMIPLSGSIQLLGIRVAPRMARSLKRIYKKLNTVLYQKQKISARKFSGKLEISATNVRRVLKITDPIKKIIEPSLSDDQKIKLKRFANWL